MYIPPWLWFSYSVTVKVDDGNSGTDTIAVTITVTDVEEAGTVALSTTQPLARTQLTATLTDPDGGVTLGTTWQWASSNAQSGAYTNITGATSNTYTPADGDVGNYLRATASYTDRRGPNKTAAAVLANAVQAGTNRAPAFGGLTSTRDVAEGTASGQPVGDPVAATDLDNDSLTYSLTGTDATSFTVDSTGQIKVGTSTTLDHEAAKNSYTVIVQVRDSKDAEGTADTATDDTIVVTINVTDVEEEGEVTLSTYQPPARVEITATLSDPDGGVTSITWKWAKTSNPLDLVNNSWQDITGATSSSYTPAEGDVNSYLRATASYTDRRGANKSAQAATTQAVGAGANRSPDFGATTDTRSFPENAAANTNIGDVVTADDPDTGNTPAYSLDTTGATSFDIDSASGQIKTKSGVTYDHETTPSYSVTVTADDNNGGTDTIDVTINVTDVNEKPTFDEGSPTTRSISENAGTGADIGSPIAAADPDDGDTLTYTLGGTDAGSFDIVATSGQLQTKSALDKETKDSYTVTVSVRDSKADDGTANSDDDDTITVNITVTDANDAPEFSAASITRAVRENTGAVEDLGGPVTATDGDDDTLTYSLEGTDKDAFHIIPGTGQIQTKSGVTYDHETTPRYSITVRADDGNGGTATKEVTVNVTDANEPPLKPGKPTVSRASNTVVSVTWTAPDNTGRPPILHYQYQYKKSAEQTWSGVPLYTSGPVTSVTIGTLDAGTSYDVLVWAVNDEGPGPWSDSGTGSTNSPPDFSGATAEREVAENTVGVTSIGAPVTASDSDSDSLAYTLEGADANSFQIVSTSGQIETKADVTYDHEAKPSYTVTVKSDDSNGGTDTIEVTITVTDVNEAPAFDDVSPTTREVLENTGADTNIGTPVAATDPDDGDSLTYSLGGTDVSSFDIDTSTGQLKTKAALDHETKASYEVTVSVRDSKADDGTPDTATDDDITVTITVTDVNDPPEFPATESGARSIAENTAADTNIGAPVRATDADNDKLTYTLEGTDHGSFAIDESSGQLKTKSALDHEDKESYTVKVKASDGNDGVATIDVTITVTDVNEAPSFDSETATRNVPENTAANQPVGQPVPAEDPDDGDSLTYSLGGTDSASFGITGSTGQITVGTGTTPDFETKPSYEVTVTATDSSNLSDTITVTINVTEGNDPPVFATDTATRSVAENTGTGQNIGSPFKATDAEEETLTYTLEGTDAASFDIVSTSGQLRTKAALDYETKSSYSVTVKAADTSGGSGTIEVTITVTDVNEPPSAPGQPVVSEVSASSVSVTWTAPANGDRPAITGYDLRYKKTDDPRWSGATYAIPIPATNLDITRLDASTSYDVQVRAKNDEGTGPWSATGAGSTGNTAPAFANSATTRDVPENTPADVEYRQPGRGYGRRQRRLADLHLGTGSRRRISSALTPSTGQLKTKAPLDHEAKGRYQVIVTATDSANASDNILVVITVTNVNERPHFGPGADNRTVDENTAPGGPVGLPVSAEDDDAGDTLTYSMGGQDSASFGINGSTGLITVGAGTRLDFEDGTKTTYEVTVTATDSSHLSATITVTIEVLNVDEDGGVTLSQLQPQVGTALTVSLDDQDGSVAGLTWKWEISTDETNWDPIANATSASYTPVVGDIGKFLRVTASYDDGEGVNKTAQAAAPNAVRAAPPTNEAPELPSQLPALTVTENTGAGENVGAPVTATDADQEDTLTYKLSGTDAPSFSIVPASGQIQTKAALDYEAKSTYTVTVTATDPSGESDTVTVTITVTDVNESPLLAPGIPAMIQNSQTSLTMAWTAPSSTGRPAVTDYDYRYKKNSETDWTEKTFLTITTPGVQITGLEATTYYNVQVRATNDEGTGDWSDSGIGVTRTLPNNRPRSPVPQRPAKWRKTRRQRENIGNPGRRPGHGQRRSYLHTGRIRRQLLHDRRGHRPVEDQDAAGPRNEGQLLGDGESGGRPRRQRLHRRQHQRGRRERTAGVLRQPGRAQRARKPARRRGHRRPGDGNGRGRRHADLLAGQRRGPGLRN